MKKGLICGCSSQSKDLRIYSSYFTLIITKKYRKLRLVGWFLALGTEIFLCLVWGLNALNSCPWFATHTHSLKSLSAKNSPKATGRRKWKRMNVSDFSPQSKTEIRRVCGCYLSHEEEISSLEFWDFLRRGFFAVDAIQSLPLWGVYQLLPSTLKQIQI